MTRSPAASRIHVPFPAPLLPARFVTRPNRFLLMCTLDDADRGACPAAAAPGAAPSPVTRSAEPVAVHLADPGRLKELLLPGRRVWLRPAASPTRKTDWSAVLVESPDGTGLVSVDTSMPNRLIHRALAAGALEEFGGWSLERAEWAHRRSRIDFLLTRGTRKLALEIKSVTLVEDGVARFPDAITARGARHVRELTELAQHPDWEAAILFVLQRDDAHRIEAAHTIDPTFATALADAKTAGVRILGRRCQVTLTHLHLGPPVPAS